MSYKNPAACAVIKSAVADVIAAVGFPWVPAVVMVSAVSDVTDADVVLTVIDAPRSLCCCRRP